MEVLVLDGKNYVKASKAARELGYATDYVGQLCRNGHIDAHLIGRTWYVNQTELHTHKTEKKRISRVKAREYAKKSIEEHRIKINQKQNNAQNIDIRYESDSENLIPTVRKLAIETVREEQKVSKIEPRVPEKSFRMENEGDKVLMSGPLEVIDVTDGEIDADTTVLTPTRIRHQKNRKAPVEAQEEIPVDEETKQKPNFLSRLEEHGAVEAEMDTEQTVKVVGGPATDSDKLVDDPLTVYTPALKSKPIKSFSLFYISCVLLISTLIDILSLGLSSTINYDTLKQPQAATSVSFSKETIIEIIELKI